MSTLRKIPPSGAAWLHEIKHDGYRAQAQFSDGVRIFTRGGHDCAAPMPTIAAAVSALPVNNVILDGELVAVDAKGQAVFYELPTAVSAQPTRVKARLIYYAFDLLYLDGFDLRAAALIDRKRVLEALLDNTPGMQLIKYVDHIEGDGAVVLGTRASWNWRASCQSEPTHPFARGSGQSGSRPSVRRGARRTRIASS